MLIDIIDKGSLSDSGSTTYPTGGFSIWYLVFICFGIIYCLWCMYESSSVLCITLINTSSMQDLILQGMQQKLQESCSRCNKNTWYVESNFLLQPSKYLLLFVNGFRYTNNSVTKDRCSFPMDTTVMLGPLKFNLRATIDHHGASIHSGHYTASINCCKKKTIRLQRQQNYGVWNYW